MGGGGVKGNDSNAVIYVISLRVTHPPPPRIVDQPESYVLKYRPSCPPPPPPSQFSWYVVPRAGSYWPRVDRSGYVKHVGLIYSSPRHLLSTFSGKLTPAAAAVSVETHKS